LPNIILKSLMEVDTQLAECVIKPIMSPSGKISNSSFVTSVEPSNPSASSPLTMALPACTASSVTAQTSPSRNLSKMPLTTMEHHLHNMHVDSLQWAPTFAHKRPCFQRQLAVENDNSVRKFELVFDDAYF